MARGKGIPPCKAAELETGKSARLFKKPPAKIWVGGWGKPFTEVLAFIVCK